MAPVSYIGALEGIDLRLCIPANLLRGKKQAKQKKQNNVLVPEKDG